MKVRLKFSPQVIGTISPLPRIKRCSPVPELSSLPAPYRGWTRAGERRVQDNLHAHAQNEPIKHQQTILGPKHAARVSVSRNAFLSSRSEKNCFDVTYCGKKHKNGKMEIWLSWSVYSYRQRVRVIPLFSNNFYMYFLASRNARCFSAFHTDVLVFVAWVILTVCVIICYQVYKVFFADSRSLDGISRYRSCICYLFCYCI